MKEVFNGMPPDHGSDTQAVRHDCFLHGNAILLTSR